MITEEGDTYLRKLTDREDVFTAIISGRGLIDLRDKVSGFIHQCGGRVLTVSPPYAVDHRGRHHTSGQSWIRNHLRQWGSVQLSDLFRASEQLHTYSRGTGQDGGQGERLGGGQTLFDNVPLSGGTFRAS